MTILCHDSVHVISLCQRRFSGTVHMTSPSAVAKTPNLHIVSANLQAAHSNSALFTLAVSVTRSTETDSAQIMSTESGSGVS